MGNGSLGEMGKAKTREVESFTWFGPCGAQCVQAGAAADQVHTFSAGCAEIRLGSTTELILMRFLDQADAIDQRNTRVAMQLLGDVFRNMVTPEDYDRFMTISIRENQDTTDLMGLMKLLIEGVTGRPIKRRSGSSPGRRDAKTKSSRDSSSRVMHRLERSGRPDLAIAVRDSSTR